MSINKLSYSEYLNKPNQWVFPEMEFNDINLIVGRNSSGKTRILSVILSLAQTITGKKNPLFDSGNFDFHVDYKDKKFHYVVKFDAGQISLETLSVDGVEKLTRDKSGAGEIWYEKEGRNLPFQLPTNALAVLARRDQLQHSYLIDLYDWASGVVLYHFGSEFGKSRVMVLDDYMRTIESNDLLDDPTNLVGTYSAGFTKFGKKLDKAIIKHMGLLGYDLTDVASTSVEKYINAAGTLLGVVTTERDLGFPLPQFFMSQGMYRALAIVIHLNIHILSKNKAVLLIDDIGEGLDFERSAAIIDLLIKQCKAKNIQLLMTSNDRFVMNKVPLDYWSVIKRKGSKIKIYNAKNSPKQFSDFKYMGINNFDFFASDFFVSDSIND